VLGRLKWKILDQLPALAGGNGPKRAPALAILEQLHSAARHDEHGVALQRPLVEAEQAAIELIIEQLPDPAPPGDGVFDLPGVPAPLEPVSPPAPPVSVGVVRRVSASDVAGAVEELCEDADAHPGATYEISWRIVQP
jgi:hypothetical protein